ncbi:MAG: hypothetical protein H6765_11105 [Candidatus Peribacteria bacterium]|nr:MAG: hypothetical protein H6765_11105 [Candidatus Peribacteria bacterium]
MKNGKVNISDAIVHISAGEARLVNMDVPLYDRTDPRSVPGYEPK